VILVGKLLGTEVLGGYSLARQFCFRLAMVINPVLTRVAFPVIAKLQQSKKLSSIYCQLSGGLAIINFPLYVCLAVFSEPIVLIAFGEQWHGIVPVFQLMASWCLIRSTMNPVGSLLMAVGKVTQLLKWNVYLSIIIPLSIYVGSMFGIQGIVIALILLQTTSFIAHLKLLLFDLVKIDTQSLLKPLSGH